MDVYGYMQLPNPQEIIDQYKLDKLARNSIAYIEICKGMSRLKQTGKLANDRLWTHLANYDYTPDEQIAPVWQHDSTRQT